MEVQRRDFLMSGTMMAAATAAAPALAQIPPRSSPALAPDSGLFDGFEARWVRTRGADIFLRHGGEGPPLLLLHGNPLTHASWHKVAGPLSRRFRVVAADLRGYGDSVGPTEGGPDHANYSFRTMAQDQVEVMAALGYDRFYLAGRELHIDWRSITPLACARSLSWTSCPRATCGNTPRANGL